STIALYGGADDKIFAEYEFGTGTVTLEGKASDTGYTFTGNQTTVTTVAMNQQMTETSDITIDITLDGSAASGTAKLVYTCEGPSIMVGPMMTMNACAAMNKIDCTTTADFVGTEVDGVQLQHNL